jgi:hypothetical protein
MKRTLFVFAMVIASVNFSHAQKAVAKISIDVVIGKREPVANEINLMQAEEKKHPNVAKSMHDLEDAMAHLHNAPDDFGGNKAQAEADLKQAWISLRKALYYRICQDAR